MSEAEALEFVHLLLEPQDSVYPERRRIEEARLERDPGYILLRLTDGSEFIVNVESTTL